MRPHAAIAGMGPLQMRERIVWVMLALLGVIQAWNLGATRLPAQLLNLVLALTLGLVCVLAATQGEQSQWRRLLRQPTFYFVFALLGLVFVQMLNPAWLLETGSGLSKGVEPADHLAWLPHGVVGPLYHMSSQRAFLILLSAGLAFCIATSGIESKRHANFVLCAIAINGGLAALVALLQKAAGTYEILGFIESPVASFHGTFIYGNHGAAYFNLVGMLAFALTAHRLRTVERWDWSSLGLTLSLACCALVCVGSALASGSGLGMSVAFAQLLIAIPAIAFLLFLRKAWVALAGGGVVVLLGLVLVLLTVDFGRVRLEYAGMAQKLAQHEHMPRFQSVSATWKMASEAPFWGYGAGSFRYFFPPYQQEHYYLSWSPGHNPAALRWHYAHSDPLQIMTEIGIPGFLLFLGLGFAIFIQGLLDMRAVVLPVLLWFAALVAVFWHSFLDYLFYNPSVLMSLAVITGTLLRWARLESRSQSEPADTGKRRRRSTRRRRSRA